MEYSSAKSLLDKYFKGETTLLEEKQLRVYFSSDKVSPDLLPYVPLFSAYTKAKEITYDAVVELPVRNALLKYAVGVAAVALIAFAFWTQNLQSHSNVATNYANDEVAILKTKQVLGVVSQMIANSTTQLEVVEEFDKASSKLFKQ